MLEARLKHATTLKKLLDAIKDLVADVNLDCNDTGISLQSMDTAHVCLIALLLRAEGFEHYRCDRNLNIGISLTNLGKIMRSVGPDDCLLMKAEDQGDSLSMIFENPKSDRMSEFNLKLMDIDADQLGIPDTEYDAYIEMSSAEYRKIVNDLSVLSESVTVSVTKAGVTFSAEGDLGSGSVSLKPTSSDSIDIDEDNDTGISIQLNQAVSCVLAMKYLVNFTKASALSSRVTLGISSDVPVLIEYKVADVGYVRYYLAPKMDDEE